jgi:hypothetical protein
MSNILTIFNLVNLQKLAIKLQETIDKELMSSIWKKY